MNIAVDRTILGYTLVDITSTGVIRDIADQEIARNQQRNWETVLQCIGLRAQPIEIACRADEVDLKQYQFGEMYEGKHKVWSFAFTTEHAMVFDNGRDPVGFLNESFDEVPIVTYLTETARFLLPVFYTSGAIKNIYFTIPPSGLNT
jgi:hypothetical protein